MHPPDARARAETLIAAGVNDCEISRRLGIPRTTIRDWRHGRHSSRAAWPTCPRCWRTMTPIRFSIDDYSELFGLYLGDGSISASPRTYRLRVTLDAQYPRIVEEARLLVERTFPDNRVDVVARDEEGCCDVSVYHAHLPCLFPQHGAGPKFLRELSFELWQLAVVAASPWPFIRGCIRSDGCVFINRTGRYRYLSYSFANRSHRIAGLLALALQAAGIDDYRLTRDPRKGMSQLRVNRRASVALMRAHVGLKE